MKTMKNAVEIVRVPEELVQRYLDDGYVLCSKEEWKEKVRDKDVQGKA